MNDFTTRILATHKNLPARITEISTPHGKFITPVFMPVATRAGVNNMTPSELIAAKSQIILGGNTYHMVCAPGMRVIEKAGGMHEFMNWHGPMLTDSGGFQIFSLSKNQELCSITEQGAVFTLPDSNEKFLMTPEKSIATQKIIGADIIMAFDQCTEDCQTYENVEKIMHRTHRWLLQSKDYHSKNPYSAYGNKQALFGIIQGGIYDDLRLKSTEFIKKCDLDGIAIGGESIGFDMQKTSEILKLLTPVLPKDKPRYTMGVGMSPQDLLDVAKYGIDMFDCVAPTRNARHGALYSGKILNEGSWLRFTSAYPNQRLLIKKAEFANDDRKIMADCDCYTCNNFSRAYLHYLVKIKSNLFTALASIHNVHVLGTVCEKMRECIMENSNEI